MKTFLDTRLYGTITALFNYKESRGGNQIHNFNT